jgi:PIN domain nuclease of toxin-antitoxin system
LTIPFGIPSLPAGPVKSSDLPARHTYAHLGDSFSTETRPERRFHPERPWEHFLVSAASAWEIATKVRLGKLPSAESIEKNFLSIAQQSGFVLVPIEPEIALQAGRLPGTHGDPFDRMIAAEALAQNIAVLSLDRELDTFGIRRIW